MPVDPLSRERFDLTKRASVRLGQDIVDSLDRVKLLLTPARRKEIRVQLAVELLRHLQDAKPHELLRRSNRSLAACTPEDMHREILAFMVECVDVIKKED